MRKFALLLPLLLILFGLITESASAELYLGGGPDAAIGDLAKSSDLGFHAHAALGFVMSEGATSKIKLLIDLRHGRFSSDVASDGDRTLTSFGPSLRIGFSHRSGTELYLLAGAGAAHVKRFSHTAPYLEVTPVGVITRQFVVQELSEDDLFVSLGVAALAPGEKSHLYFELRFTDISGREISDIRFASLTCGIEF